jgi:hypothetical protein
MSCQKCSINGFSARINNLRSTLFVRVKHEVDKASHRPMYQVLSGDEVATVTSKRKVQVLYYKYNSRINLFLHKVPLSTKSLIIVDGGRVRSPSQLI